MGVCLTQWQTRKTPGYKASKEELLTRLARVEGQVRGVTRMVEEDRYCIDVLTQIEAAEAALDKVALGLLDDHVRNCMRGRQGRLREAGPGADGRGRPAGQLLADPGTPHRQCSWPRPVTVRQLCRVIRRIRPVISRPTIGSTIGAPSATAAALTITPTLTIASLRA